MAATATETNPHQIVSILCPSYNRCMLSWAAFPSARKSFWWVLTSNLRRRALRFSGEFFVMSRNVCNLCWLGLQMAATI